MTRENRIENARADLEAADQALRAAEALLLMRLLRDCVSRTYYAAFHAARALLVLHGYEPKTHAGLHALVGQHLVHTGLLATRFGLLLTRLQAYRHASDHAFRFELTEEDVRVEIDAVRELVELAARAVEAC